MRNITSFAISAAALAGIAAAEVETSAYVGVHSDYIYRGADFGGDQSLTDFGLDFAGSCDCGLDWYAGLWYAQDATNELDIFAGVTKDLGFGTIDLGYITYTYPSSGNSDSEIYVGLSTSYQGLDLGLTTSFGLDGEYGEDVTWIEGSIGYGVDLAGYAVALEVATGYQTGDAGIDGFAYGSITASTDVALNDSMTLSPYVSYIQTSDAYQGFHGFVGGASLSFSF